ncbi:hypothetical protein A2Y47_00205 [Candidatus Giovannonibacteria bacterium RIFCSPLOWO2_12_43_8]|uniref:Antitoxin n=1 Tax=Candidatus Giovannonibacteria bacterium RIFCSPLOWO2_12_43_8 TaxID=1798361 RepID=A0A1F5Y1C0_9BACT|nr:MAG: hypothetical protein A2Y47_00205 [Candidatus Giovannonibacteria bacterium RIFCSPLOWO2_12_43_8]
MSNGAVLEKIEKLEKSLQELKANIFVSRKDFVVISRKEYERLIKKAVPLVRLSASEKKELNQARKEMIKGDYVTLDELIYGLGNKNPRKSLKKSK